MSQVSGALQRTAGHLRPHRESLVTSWVKALSQSSGTTENELAPICGRRVDALFEQFERGNIDGAVEPEPGTDGDPTGSPLALRLLDHSLLKTLLAACSDKEALAEAVLALDDVGVRRMALSLRGHEEEASRRLLQAQDDAARYAEKARELARANEALRASQLQSQHRVEQIGLLASVVHRLAAVTDPETLMQGAAELIQTRMNHTYVAVVVLDDEGVVIGRWAGRQGVGRRSSGRAQGPAGGLIGRALRKRAPQVVRDVSKDPDYHPDVPGTLSEMVIPLLDGGDAVGALDFQSEKADDFDLDDVAVGETLAEFMVIALRNARLLAELRKGGA